MEKEKKNDFLIYTLLTCIFFIPLGVFIFCTWFFLPQKIATTVIGFVGLIVIVGGPFWAMQAEQKLRNRFSSKSENDGLLDLDLSEDSK